ncbi:MAG: hypothetical protein ACYC48_02645 [Minisyncoccota bacterium]
MQSAQDQINNGRSSASAKMIALRAAKPSLAIIFALTSSLFVLVPLAYASSGTISSSYKYAWSNVGGWVNFAPTNSTVTVTDSALTGYAWSANDGWINFSPSNGGVTNSGGALGGFAWDQSAGWVNFAGVTIDSSGKFHGQATGANGYAINFSCTNCDVRTDWRPASVPAPVAVPAAPGSISPVVISPLPSVPPVTPPPGEAPPGVQPPAGQRPPTRSIAGNAPGAAAPGGVAYSPGKVSPGAGTSSAVSGPARAPSRITTSTTGSLLKSAARFFKVAAVPFGIIISIVAVLFLLIFFR